MNRDILFRGKRIDGKGWVYGDLNQHDIHHGTSIRQNGCIISAVITETVGQFTGREDAGINGNPVYEGDLIKNVDTGHVQVVYWNEDECAWYCRYVDDAKRVVSLADSLGNLNKVCGTIHDTHLTKQS